MYTVAGHLISQKVTVYLKVVVLCATFLRRCGKNISRGAVFNNEIWFQKQSFEDGLAHPLSSWHYPLAYFVCGCSMIDALGPTQLHNFPRSCVIM